VPDYLVCLNAASLTLPAEASGLAELLSSGLPVKILVQHDDLLDNRNRVAAQARVVAGMALGLNDVFVLQTAASNLYPLRSRVLKGFEYDGPALFNVYSGAGGATGLPPYLAAAAAMESRAFPAFSYDPAAGDDHAARFSLENNPQPEADWPVHTFSYEDAAHQSVREELTFTLVDFAACDRRYADYFASLKEEPAAAVPTLRMVDAQNRLQRIIVAEPVVREAVRCLDAWRGLQARVKRPAPTVMEAPVAAPAPASAQPVVEAAAEPATAAPAGDAPYIETPRCTTCEECVKINNRLFVYDANKQAYIADLKAGSYKELVEAAENCQVSIIHPGKPLDPTEPGLAELMERAAPFM
jgi:ferredoxin